MPTFAERLRELREKSGLTQAQLAEASGLPIGSIRNYEQGQREPYWSVLFKLARALHVSVEVFGACVESGPLPLPPKKKARQRKPEPL